MPDQRDLIALLEDVGATCIAKTPHLKYRLPNGELFVTGSTPSYQRPYTKAVSDIRRLLRDTHPHLAEKTRKTHLPKHKRFGASIAEIVSSKAPPAPEAEYQILPAEPEAEPETLIHKAPRKMTEHKPPPSICRTLSPEQLKEANKLLITEGPTAMTAFINNCREQMVPATKDVIEVRYAEPVLVPPTHHTDEDEEMSHMLERARKELEASAIRLKEYEETLVKTKALQEAETAKHLQLEEYIQEHEILASKAAMLMGLLPPQEAPKPLQMPTHNKPVRAGNGRRSIAPYGIREVRELVFPILRAKGSKFTLDEFVEATAQSKLPPMERRLVSVCMHGEANSKNGVVEYIGNATFRFRGTQAHAKHKEHEELEAASA